MALGLASGILPWADVAAPWLYAAALIFARIVTCLSLIPDFGMGTVPGRIRLILAVTITVALDAALGVVYVPLPEAPSVMLIAFAREVVIGAGLGLAVRLIHATCQVAGDLVGLSMGLSLNTLFDPTAGEMPLATGRLFGLIASLLFFVLGGHLLVVLVLYEHFAQFPVGAETFLLPSVEAIAQAGSRLIASAVLLAAPVIVVALMINASLGFIMRVVPSVNIFGIGLGLLMIGGFVALAFQGDALMLFVDREVEELPERMFELTGARP